GTAAIATGRSASRVRDIAACGRTPTVAPIAHSSAAFGNLSDNYFWANLISRCAIGLSHIQVLHPFPEVRRVERHCPQPVTTYAGARTGAAEAACGGTRWNGGSSATCLRRDQASHRELARSFFRELTCVITARRI